MFTDNVPSTYIPTTQQTLFIIRTAHSYYRFFRHILRFLYSSTDQQTLTFSAASGSAGGIASVTMGPKSEAERKAETQSEFRKFLLSPGPDLVVADEAHLIKDNRGATRNILTKIQTRRRIALTGPPLQNNLEEYWCMVNFVRPRFLGTIAILYSFDTPFYLPASTPTLSLLTFFHSSSNTSTPTYYHLSSPML